MTRWSAEGIVRHMPNYSAELDAVLRALADPTRRMVVERLAKSPAVVSDLLAPFSMTLPSLLQHLRVLEDEEDGKTRWVQLRVPVTEETIFGSSDAVLEAAVELLREAL